MTEEVEIKGKLTGNKVWLILDGRAWDDPDKASVYCCYSSHKEPPDEALGYEGSDGDTLEYVKKERDEHWPDGVIFEYEEKKGDAGTNYMINQKLIG
jgi:hypothetical protein